jgi:hypothetical protein
MDQERFDDLTRALATSQTRRGFLGTVAAALAAALTAAESSAAPKVDKPSKCYGAGSHCTNARQCCSGMCLNRQCAPEIAPECVADLDCPVNEVCQAGSCVPADPDPECDENSPCAPVNMCVDGVCVPKPCTTHEDCGGCLACQDGYCAEPICGNGVCEPCEDASSCPGDCTALGCEPGSTQSCYTGPEGTLNVGVCVAGTQTCLNDRTWGTCTGDTTPGTETCNGLDDDCDGATDEGELCPPTETETHKCEGGECVFDACRWPYAQCSGDTGCETNTQTDVMNCNGCGQVCLEYPNSSPVCSGGICQNACDPGYTSCIGDRFDEGCPCPGICGGTLFTCCIPSGAPLNKDFACCNPGDTSSGYCP